MVNARNAKLCTKNGASASAATQQPHGWWWHWQFHLRRPYFTCPWHFRCHRRPYFCCCPWHFCPSPPSATTTTAAASVPFFRQFFPRRHSVYSNFNFVVLLQMHLVIVLSAVAERSAAAAADFYWPTTDSSNSINNNNLYWSNNNNNNIGGQQQYGAVQAVQQPNGEEKGIVEHNNALLSSLLGTAIAAGPIGILPAAASASLSGGGGGGIDPIGTLFGGTFDGNGRNSNNNNNFGLGDEMDQQQQEEEEMVAEQFTRFPTLIPVDKVRQKLLVMATEPTLAAAVASAGAAGGPIDVGEGDGTAQEIASGHYNNNNNNAFVGADREPVPMGEVRDVSMMRSIPVFGYGQGGGGAAAAGAFGAGGIGTNPFGAFGTMPSGGGSVGAFGTMMPNDGAGSANCFGVGTGCAAASAWPQQQFGANNINDGTAPEEAMPSSSSSSSSMFGLGLGAGGVDSFYVGGSDGGAYEYPLIDETDPYASAGQQQGRQQHNTYGGFVRGNAEIDGGPSPVSAPSYPTFGRFGGGGGGGDGMGESAEEWEEEMMVGGGGAMGPADGDGAVPTVPLWMGGRTAPVGETENGDGDPSRTDSEERQRYSQYLETIHRRYGVVPSPLNNPNSLQLVEENNNNNNNNQLLLNGHGLAAPQISPSAMFINGNSFGGGPMPTMPYAQHHFGTGASAPTMPKVRSPLSARVSAPFDTFPPAPVPCTVVAADPAQTSASFGGRGSVVGAAMSNCAEMASSFSSKRKSQFVGTDEFRAAATEVGAVQGRAVVVPWKAVNAVLVPAAAATAALVQHNKHDNNIAEPAPAPLPLHQRKTVSPMPNFNGAISGHDGGPFSVADAQQQPLWRQHQKNSPPMALAQQNAPIQLGPPNWTDRGGDWQMPATTKSVPRIAELVTDGGGQRMSNNNNNNNNLQQQLLEQSLLLELLTTKQQQTTTTTASINGDNAGGGINRRMMPSQQQQQIVPMPPPLPPPATTVTMEMPTATTTTAQTTPTSTTTTHDDETAPIQKSTTSVQALSQQIRRLPAVLYADSRKADSRQLEVLLRDSYGLPLVTFYADKIGRLAVVEANLAKLTAQRGMPYLFICGTFIGSLEHIQNYHEQKQIPRLVEFVCSGEAAEKNGAETAASRDAKALDKNNGDEGGGRKRRRESKRRKNEKRKEGRSE